MTSRSCSSELEAQALGELVVDLERIRRRHFLHRNVEGRFLTGEVARAVVVGEGHGDGLFLTGGHALELLGEAGDELAGAEADHGIVVGAARERLAVDLAGVGNGQLVAVLRLAVLGRERARTLGEFLDLRIDIGIGNLGDRTLDRDRTELGEFDLGQDLVGHGVGQIGFAVENLLGGALVLGQLEVRLLRSALAPTGHCIASDLVDDRLNDLRHFGLAEHPLQMGHRHLAGPESFDSDLPLKGVEPRREPVVQLSGRHHDLKFPLQPFDHRRVDLHSLLSLLTHWIHENASRSGQHPARGLVRAEGLEPPRLSSREPKSRASTSSATPASRGAAEAAPL